MEIIQRNDPAKVIAYRRYGASGEDVLVVVNLMNKAYTAYDIGAPSAGPWRVRANTERAAYGAGIQEGQSGTLTAVAAPKDGKPFTLTIELGAYGAMILSQ